MQAWGWAGMGLGRHGVGQAWGWAGLGIGGGGKKCAKKLELANSGTPQKAIIVIIMEQG